LELTAGHTFYFKSTENENLKGVGFILHKELEIWITEIQGISDRIARVLITKARDTVWKTIQVYAQTTSHQEEEVADLYEVILKILDSRKSH